MCENRGMADPGETLREHVDVLTDIAAQIPGGVLGLTCARDADVVDLIAAAQAVVLSAQGILAAVSGEVARRSEGGTEGSLAKQHGCVSARTLLAQQGCMTLGDASRLIDVGGAIRPRVALSGETLPAERPHIADAVLAGRLSLSLAVLIDETVTAVAHLLIRDQADELEDSLVDKALSGTWSVARFTAYCRQIPNILDPDGAKPRDEHLAAKASIRQTRLANGMLRIVAELDPERAAFYLAAMRARTNPRRPGTTPDDDQTEGATVTDIGSKRTANQPSPAGSKLDAFTRILRDSLKADDGAQAGVDTTILVRIDLQDLLTGLGTATIDGIETPISASAARRLSAEADLIPQVFDGNSVLLDQGESKRRFTKAQRYAILAMFIGCAFPQCDIPSSMTEIHHIGRWATRHDHGKATDLLNGIPFCGFHNRLMEQGWDVEFGHDHTPWFTPPAHLDARRTPIRGGNLRQDHAA